MITTEELKGNLASVEKNIEEACKKAGRDRGGVKLISVSKTNPNEVLEEAYGLGVRVFGENKVQELTGKIEYFAEHHEEQPEWHLIGHLQTNKVKYIVGKVKLIHSVDSEKLAAVIDSESKKKGVISDILVEINIGNEESKFGIDASETMELVKSIAKYPNIRVKGLMCIAPYTDNPENNRKFFKKIKKLSVDIADKNIDNVSMCELSMGMTGDYCVAIEEGATMVRVGTGIFGRRNYAI